MYLFLNIFLAFVPISKIIRLVGMRMGMCGQNGSVFGKKSLNMSLIFHEKSLTMGLIFNIFWSSLCKPWKILKVWFVFVAKLQEMNTCFRRNP